MKKLIALVSTLAALGVAGQTMAAEAPVAQTKAHKVAMKKHHKAAKKHHKKAAKAAVKNPA